MSCNYNIKYYDEILEKLNEKAEQIMYELLFEYRQIVLNVNNAVNNFFNSAITLNGDFDNKYNDVIKQQITDFCEKHYLDENGALKTEDIPDYEEHKSDYTDFVAIKQFFYDQKLFPVCDKIEAITPDNLTFMCDELFMGSKYYYNKKVITSLFKANND